MPPPPGGIVRRDDESGLTTLEWLLIVAAVAGLAALAVVLVQSVIDDTAEQIRGSSARGTAAKVAAAQITREAHADSAKLSAAHRRPGVTNATKAREATAEAAKLVRKYQNDCNNLRIIYSDIPNLSVTWSPASVTISGATAATVEASIKAQWTDKVDDTTTEGCQVVGV